MLSRHMDTSTKIIRRAAQASLGAERYLTEMDANVEILDLSNKKVTSLDYVRHFVNLDWLNAGSNPLSSLAGIERVTKLRSLGADYCNVRDAAHIRNHPSLEDLSMYYCPLAALDLGEDSLIRAVGLSHTMISDVSCFSKYRYLSFLHVDWCPLRSLDGLEHCQSLMYIDASHTHVGCLSQGYSSLEDLNVRGCPVTDIDSALPHNLQSLNASRTLIRSGPTSERPELKSLDLSWTFIDSIAWLRFLPNLHRLSIAACSVTDLQPLEYCPKLRHVDVRLLPIDDVSILASMPNMERCDVSPTQSLSLPKEMKRAGKVFGGRDGLFS